MKRLHLISLYNLHIQHSLTNLILQRKYDSDTRALRISLTSLREELADLQDAHSALSRSTNQTITSQKTQITTLTHQNSLLQDELAQLRVIAEERGATVEELQSQFDELSASQETLMRRVSEEENMSVVREELHRQAGYLRTLESTNARLTSELTVLRERHTSVEVLREEKRGLEKRVQVLEELRTKVVRLEAEVEAGRREREDWYLFSFCSMIFLNNLHLSSGLIDHRILLPHPILLSLLRNPSPSCV